ncbi:MAG: tetratricopeptide repeat protein, partial [Chlorobiales bacterium]|nr:tetratricopeptide repeat protein [Chlorobiales bacterium]
MVAKAKGEYEKAEMICSNALTLAQEIGDQFRQIHAITNLAEIKLSRGDCAEAYDAAMRSVRMSKEVDHCFGLARSLNVLAEVAFAEQNLMAAKQFAEESIAISQKRNQRVCLAAALGTLGKVAWVHKSYEESREHLHKAFGIALTTDAVPRALEVLLTIVRMRMTSDDAGDGIEFLRAIFRHPKTCYDVKVQARQLLGKHTGQETLHSDGFKEISDLQSADAMLKELSTTILTNVQLIESSPFSGRT